MNEIRIVINPNQVISRGSAKFISNKVKDFIKDGKTRVILDFKEVEYVYSSYAHQIMLELADMIAEEKFTAFSSDDKQINFENMNEQVSKILKLKYELVLENLLKTEGGN